MALAFVFIIGVAHRIEAAPMARIWPRCAKLATEGHQPNVIIPVTVPYTAHHVDCERPHRLHADSGRNSAGHLSCASELCRGGLARKKSPLWCLQIIDRVIVWPRHRKATIAPKNSTVAAENVGAATADIGDGECPRYVATRNEEVAFRFRPFNNNIPNSKLWSVAGDKFCLGGPCGFLGGLSGEPRGLVGSDQKKDLQQAESRKNASEDSQDFRIVGHTFTRQDVNGFSLALILSLLYGLALVGLVVLNGGHSHNSDRNDQED